MATAVAIALTAATLIIGALSAPPSNISITRDKWQVEPELQNEQRKLSEFPLTSASFTSIDAEKRKALRNENRRWPNAVVPYLISPSVDDVSLSARQVIQDAMDHWEHETCIRFVPANTRKHKDYVVFRKGSWCRSLRGRRGGLQNITVAAGCFKVGSVVHEIGHAIGWVHEHTRPDRDEYIEVLRNKVPKGKTAQFSKKNDSYINTFGLPYDYGSIMHYNGRSGVIRAHDPRKQKVMGQRVKLSFYDVKLANLMYKCAEKKNCDLDLVSCIGEGYVGPKCKCVYPSTYKNGQQKANLKIQFQII